MSCGGGGTKDGESGGAEGINNAGDEGDLGSDDGEVDLIFLGDGEVVGGCGAGEGKALGYFGDAGIARRGEDAGDGGALGEFPGEGVFAAAGADDEDIQGGMLLKLE